jgi:hypothetical protein
MFESSDSEDRHSGGGEFTPGGGGPPELAGLEAMPPGPELAQVLAGLDPLEIADAHDLVEVVAACGRLKAWADAIEVRTAAALTGHPVCHAPEAVRHGFNPVRAAGQLLAPRLGQSPTTACHRVDIAMQLVDELGDTVSALSEGQLDYQKAAALAVGVRTLDPPDGCADALTGEVITPDGIRLGLVARVEARVLPRAGARSLRQHRDAIARAVAAIAPQTAEQRHQHAHQDRRVEFRSEADGMAWLAVYGPALDLTAVEVMLDAAAEAAKTANPDDLRSLDQLRVDTLSQLAWAILEDGQLPNTEAMADDGCDCGRPGRRQRSVRRRLAHRNGRAATVHVTVPISTLLGLDERPGELDGYGPITAEAARRVAAHGTWRRLLTDPATGALLDYGTTRYPPPADLVDHVHNRDQTCRFPTCSRAARLCQFDHTIPAGSTGWTTSARNGGPLSAGCHNGKTHAGWHLEQPEPGRFIWTAPTGHTYQVDPEIVGPIIAASTEPEPPIDSYDPGPQYDIPDPDPPPF